ncbi:hypothetical protein J6590_052435 [Homalodisca vitripennis]|nr:hypothetical protein J6590_052435 [Homalodisca vitripennis]
MGYHPSLDKCTRDAVATSRLKPNKGLRPVCHPRPNKVSSAAHSSAAAPRRRLPFLLFDCSQHILQTASGWPQAKTGGQILSPHYRDSKCNDQQKPAVPRRESKIITNAARNVCQRSHKKYAVDYSNEFRSVCSPTYNLVYVRAFNRAVKLPVAFPASLVSPPIPMIPDSKMSPKHFNYD